MDTRHTLDCRRSKPSSLKAIVAVACRARSKPCSAANQKSAMNAQACQSSQVHDFTSSSSLLTRFRTWPRDHRASQKPVIARVHLGAAAQLSSRRAALTIAAAWIICKNMGHRRRAYATPSSTMLWTLLTWLRLSLGQEMPTLHVTHLRLQVRTARSLVRSQQPRTHGTTYHCCALLRSSGCA